MQVPSGQSTAPRRVFVFGAGYTGTGLCLQLARNTWHVNATYRSTPPDQLLRQQSIRLFPFDADLRSLSAEGRRTLRSCSHVLTTIAPDQDRRTDPVLACHYDLIAEIAPHLEWFGYVSSTGVYGDYGGQQVDERSECRAVSGSGAVRLMAEQQWMSMSQQCGLPLHIFRLGGIYGPGRSALDAAQKGSPSPSQVRRSLRRLTARCHVADVVGVIMSSMAHPRPDGSIYNVVDDDPAPRSQVVQYAKQLLDTQSSSRPTDRDRATSAVQLPSQSAQISMADIQAGQISMADTQEAQKKAVHSNIGGGSRVQEEGVVGSEVSGSSGASGVSGRAGAGRLPEKRVSNRKIKEELGFDFSFPSYREGLWAIAEGNQRPFDWQ